MTRQTELNWEQLRQYRRINVVGTSGSGKSTFSRQLAERLDIPHYELDRLYWKPNWQESTDAEIVEKVREVAAEENWIIDGNYTITEAVKWSRAELVIWLDMSFARTFSRVTRRVFQRSFSQQEIWPGTGNRETLGKAFLTRDSILLWVLTSYRHNRRRYLAAMESPEYEHLQFVRLRSPREVEQFLAGMTRD
jgi:adenylate kinase family enzyme